MADTVRPTKKQRQLLDYIEQFITEHGYSPSYREIMNGCDYTSVATVALHVNSLIKRGHLRKRDHSARSLEVVHTTGEPATKANGDHEAWLIGLIESYISDNAEQAEHSLQKVANSGVLIEALRLLGMAEHADNLHSKLLAGQEISASAEKTV
jgi:SOS-response transcriptional repressor LexA